MDKEATWGKSKTDGWVYGHGSFSVVSHKIPVLGIFKWMPNSANEAKRLEIEMPTFATRVNKVCMDSKADDQKLYKKLKEDYQMQLLTVARSGMDKSDSRKKMISEIQTKQNRAIYKKRSVTVEPMQGLVKELFDLQTCWMRGSESNRWLFAAMGIAVQIAQLDAYRNHSSTWNIKEAVLGV